MRGWSWLALLPMLGLSLACLGLAALGVTTLPVAERAQLGADCVAAAVVAVLCLVLMVPLAGRRPGLAWLLLLGVPPVAGVAGLAAMPLDLSATGTGWGGLGAAVPAWLAPLGQGLGWGRIAASVVLLLPAARLILSVLSPRADAALREEARAQGAGGWQGYWIAQARPGLPAALGAAAGAFAALFLLALGLGPLLAGVMVNP